VTDNEKIKLAIKAIRTYNSEHYGWDAKYHPDELEKYTALVEMANMLKECGIRMMKAREKC
jgi:hypothetical protein